MKVQVMIDKEVLNLLSTLVEECEYEKYENDEKLVQHSLVHYMQLISKDFSNRIKAYNEED